MISEGVVAQPLLFLQCSTGSNQSILSVIGKLLGVFGAFVKCASLSHIQDA